MNATLQPQRLGRPARRLICAALALAITTFTTQAIVRSAGQPEYGVTVTQRSTLGSAPADATATTRQITLARAH